MKNQKSTFILLCCQILLCLFCINMVAAQTVNFTPKKLNRSSLFRTIENARGYIVKHQNKDGGWPLIPGGESDVEITALAIWALTDAEWGTGSRVIRSGVRYLRNKQREDGSWNNNTAHTTFALLALTNAKTDEDARYNGLQWLSNAQNPSGSWGQKSRNTGHILYTSATLVGLKKLGFAQSSFKPILIGNKWLEDLNQRNHEGFWSLPGGTQSDIFATSWALHGLSPDYDLDEMIAWLKQFQNKDGGFPRFKDEKSDPEVTSSDPEVTASVIMALTAYNDPVNTRRIAISYLTKVQEEDGSFVSDTPIEIKKPTANLQSTCFVLIAIYAKPDIEN